MADATCLPSPIDSHHGVWHRLDVIFADFWRMLEGRAQPLASQNSSSQLPKMRPPNSRKAPKAVNCKTGLIMAADQTACSSPAQEAEALYETQPGTSSTMEMPNPTSSHTPPYRYWVQRTVTPCYAPDPDSASRPALSVITRAQSLAISLCSALYLI
ncbi:Hypothetical predicted protein [Pelobates cultripes]|uniref:Uncharacterized protein n=1 Tax=Pelobates cultripes TaxID=61616 RepID=A0AAD1RDW8_PELCU|nr:Hypothetical predicted protein [Pelobates cultripes]